MIRYNLCVILNTLLRFKNTRKMNFNGKYDLHESGQFEYEYAYNDMVMSRDHPGDYDYICSLLLPCSMC